MLMIRFQRTGRTNDPAFRIVLLEKARAAKDGNIVERLGTYNPRSKALTLDKESVKAWLGKGAQPTDSIRNLLITNGVMEGKKVNALPKKTPQKSAESGSASGGKEGAETVAAAPVAEAAPITAEIPAEPAPAA